jgi:hypothetical protein
LIRQNERCDEDIGGEKEEILLDIEYVEYGEEVVY